MDWKELLITLREDTLHDRSDRIEGDSDHLWSDATLIRYMNEAHRRFARRTYCIRDATSPITQIAVVPGQDEYPLDPSVIAVLSGRYIGGGNPQDTNPFMRPDAGDLPRSGHSQLAGYRPPETTYFDVNAFQTMQPGKPLVFATDEQTVVDSTGSQGRVVLRLYPVPSQDYAGGVVALRVARTPLTKLTGNASDLETTPEIPEDYHLALVDYAAYMALRIVDHELGDPVRAAEFEATFNRKVEEAKRETIRKMFTPQPWGFGRNGFSYVEN